MSSDLMTLDDFALTLPNLKENEIILDVRGPDEFEEIRIPGSINIPHDLVLGHVDELKKYSKVYIHCKMGRRAQVAYEALKSAGLNNLVCVYDAGMHAWVQKGLPTVS